MEIQPLSEKQRMLTGRLYRASDRELKAERAWAAVQIKRFNGAPDPPDQADIIRVLLGSAGEDAEIRPPFFCDYGYNIHLGAGVFLNFNCVILDVAQVQIGARTQIGPAVQIYTADHPRDSGYRLAGLEFGRAVTIGSNVWIGGGAIILPGVTIGDDAIIGAGSVVTRSIGSGITAVGNPARPVHPWPAIKAGARQTTA